MGVVAALTIPSLVNRQSDLAAQTKLKKAIATYETAAGTYMAESGKADTSAWLSPATGDDKAKCTNVGNYFKVVATLSGSNNCTFTTSDGTYWTFNGESGFAVAYDADKAPRYGVLMWVNDGNVNTTTYATSSAAGTGADEGKTLTQLKNPPTAPAKAVDNTTTFTAPVHGYYSATKFLNSSSSDLTNGTGKADSISAVTLVKTATTTPPAG